MSSQAKLEQKILKRQKDSFTWAELKQLMISHGYSASQSSGGAMIFVNIKSGESVVIPKSGKYVKVHSIEAVIDLLEL